MFDLTPMRKDRVLLATVTGEPFQPVRLYYAIPSKPFVTRILSQLRCMDEDRAGGRWVWLYQAEAEGLTFGRAHAELPAEVHPVVIGAFRFPKKGGMTLEVRSFERASAAAKFFGPLLGPGVVARRARVINRWFDAKELIGGPEQLDRHLDQNVTVIDPHIAEQRMEQYLSGAKTQQEKRRTLERYYEDKRRERRDVPLVEDFPLAPEEETPDFMHLTMTLRFRSIRAYEHWNGNTSLILQDIIYRLAEQGAFTDVCTKNLSIQSGMTDEFSEHPNPLSQSARGFLKSDPQLIQRETTQIPKVYVLQLMPDILLRVDLRCVCREVLDRHPANGIHAPKFIELTALVNS
jgi:hypothetical protein